MVDQAAHRIRSHQSAIVQFVLHPEVFADGEANPPVPSPLVQRDVCRSLTGAEVARLIEDVVTGQQLFAGCHTPSSGFHQCEGIEQRWMQGILRGIREAHQQGHGRTTAGQAPAERFKGFRLLLKVSRAEQEISRWIPP